LYKYASNVKPDVLTGINDIYSAHVGKIIKKPSIIFTDTEDAKMANTLTFPLSSVICTPSCFLSDLGNKHVRFNGYKELAYLHPNRFQPDISVLDKLNLSRKDPYIILRFISWGASHDMKLKGIKNETEIEFIKSLEKYGRVLITSERKLDKKLEKYRLTAPPEQMHSLLHFAQLYIGEGGTMAAEAAILGTPAIHIEASANGEATGYLSGNFLELNKYGLLYFYPDQHQALKKAISILEDNNSKKIWGQRRDKLLDDKIDVTSWMVDFFERYPDSFYEKRS
jgi:predicted glycosyltransferase